MKKTVAVLGLAALLVGNPNVAVAQSHSSYPSVPDFDRLVGTHQTLINFIFNGIDQGEKCQVDRAEVRSIYMLLVDVNTIVGMIENDEKKIRREIRADKLDEYPAIGEAWARIQQAARDYELFSTQPQIGKTSLSEMLCQSTHFPIAHTIAIHYAGVRPNVLDFMQTRGFEYK